MIYHLGEPHPPPASRTHLDSSDPMYQPARFPWHHAHAPCARPECTSLSVNAQAPRVTYEPEQPGVSAEAQVQRRCGVTARRPPPAAGLTEVLPPPPSPPLYTRSILSLHPLPSTSHGQPLPGWPHRNTGSSRMGGSHVRHRGHAALPLLTSADSASRGGMCLLWKRPGMAPHLGW